MISRDQWLLIREFVDQRYEAMRDRMLGDFSRAGPLYITELNELMLGLAEMHWYRGAEQHEQVYLAVYSHQRFSTLVLTDVLGANVDDLYSDVEADDGAETADEAEAETADAEASPEDGSPEDEGTV